MKNTKTKRIITEIWFEKIFSLEFAQSLFFLDAAHALIISALLLLSPLTTVGTNLVGGVTKMSL